MWSLECAEKTDFGQLTTNLPNETENPFCYNYTKGQS